MLWLGGDVEINIATLVEISGSHRTIETNHSDVGHKPKKCAGNERSKPEFSPEFSVTFLCHTGTIAARFPSVCPVLR